MKKLLESLEESSAFSEDNANFLEELYERFLRDPNSVDPTWQETFSSIQSGATELAPRAAARQPAPVLRAELLEQALRRQAAVDRLIVQYRMRGHQAADNNPLKFAPPPLIRDLDPRTHGLGPQDMDLLFHTDILKRRDKESLREIIARLHDTYCGIVGSEYTHLVDTDIKEWIQQRLESTRARSDLELRHKRWLLELLIAAEGIEKYLHRKYVVWTRIITENSRAVPLAGKGI